MLQVRVHQEEYPFYSADGRSLGFRSREAAARLLAGGFVAAAFGRKGHLRAIYLRKADGSDPVETHPKPGTKYSFEQALPSGRRCWMLKKLDLIDEDGVRMNPEPIFCRVLVDCLTT